MLKFPHQNTQYQINDAAFIKNFEDPRKPKIMMISDIKWNGKQYKVKGYLFHPSYFQWVDSKTKSTVTLADHFNMDEHEVLATNIEQDLLPAQIIGRCSIVPENQFQVPKPPVVTGKATRRSTRNTNTLTEKIYYCKRTWNSRSRKILKTAPKLQFGGAKDDSESAQEDSGSSDMEKVAPASSSKPLVKQSKSREDLIKNITHARSKSVPTTTTNSKETKRTIRLSSRVSLLPSLKRLYEESQDEATLTITAKSKVRRKKIDAEPASIKPEKPRKVKEPASAEKKTSTKLSKTPIQKVVAKEKPDKMVPDEKSDETEASNSRLRPTRKSAKFSAQKLKLSSDSNDDSMDEDFEKASDVGSNGNLQPDDSQDGVTSDSDSGSGSGSEEEEEVEFKSSKRVNSRKRVNTQKKRIAEFKISERKDMPVIAGTVFEQASARLHVSAAPETLPCREEEYSELFEHLVSAISEASGSYISGVPGTGKTATFKAVLKNLEDLVKDGSLDDFDFVEINGMRLSEPSQAYSALWQGLTNQRVSPQYAEELLSTRFNTPSQTGRPVVVLMDELDLLVTKKQKVVYNFFNWPNCKYSQLIVVAIANTMDLPERMLSNKVSSRLGLTRMVFQTYKFDQLIKIVQSRLEGLDCFAADAIQFGARKIGSVSGDARRCLDLCRRAVEIFMANPGTDKLVSMKHITTAIQEMTSSNAVKAVQYSSFHHKLFLLSCIKQGRTTGLIELDYGSVIEELFRYCVFTRIEPPNSGVLFRICAYLGEYNLLTLESGKAGDPAQKLKLAVDEQDVFTGVRQSHEDVLLTIVRKLSQ